MTQFKHKDDYYPIIPNTVDYTVREAIRLLFDAVYNTVGKKGAPTILWHDLQLNEVGRRLLINEGPNNWDVPVHGSMGIVTLGTTHHGAAGATVGGEARVYASLVTPFSRIFLTAQDAPTVLANAGQLYIYERSGLNDGDMTKGPWFTIKSTNSSDNRTVAWLILEPV